MRNGQLVVDADAHQMEPDSMWAKFIEARYRDEVPRRVEFNGNAVLAIEGELVASEGKGKDGDKYAFSTEEFQQAVRRAMEEKHSELMAAEFSAEVRLKDMDEHGVDVQVMHPSRGGFLLGREFKDLGLLTALCRAYNDWCADYCSLDPERLRFAGMLPMQDVPAAIAEAKRAAELGAVDFYVRPNPVSGRNLNHSAYFPLWEVIEELDRPISLHDVASSQIPSFGDRMDSHTAGHILSHPFEAMAAMVSLIWWGIFENFPGLRVLHVEADAGWVPYWLQRQEQHYRFSGNAEHPELKRAPTEYFQSNIFVAARGDELTLPAAIDLLGDDNFLFNTDYPHPDGTFPDGLAAFEALPISDASRRKLWWDNPARALGLQVPARLAADVAAR